MSASIIEWTQAAQPEQCCSFCGSPKGQVNILIGSSLMQRAICDGCVKAAIELMKNDDAQGGAV
ncbi:Zinc finger, ClpX C4-type [Comamonadaceae bacterium]